jgi:ribonuclease HII
MSIITHDYLTSINNKYDISMLLEHILNRHNRCCFERIIGCLLQQKETKKALLGDIHSYCPWDIRFNDKEYHNIDYFFTQRNMKENHEYIDKHNIFQATMKGMHEVINNISIKPDKILVDGDHFNIYRDSNGELIHHECVINGDNTYMSIAAASILAKTYKDKHIEDLVLEYPGLEKYDLLNNSGYGTANHIEAIKNYGICSFHRKTFGICKNYK